MTPEKKSESIINFLPPKFKKAIAGALVSFSLATGCNVLVDASVPERPIITKTSVPSKDPEKTDPTQVATEMVPPGAVETVITPPTITPEPTATATEMPTPTEIPEKYPIDLEKLHNFPESYEYVIAHPEEFVEAPNPFKDIDAFNDWFYNKFVPLLGDYKEREVNYATSDIGLQPDFYVANAYSEPKKMLGEPEFFYFNNYGTLYPVITLNVFSDNQKAFIRTLSVILYDGDYSGEGTGVINSLSRGEKIYGIALFTNERDLYPYPAPVNNLIRNGINAYRDEMDYNQVVLGVGGIVTPAYFK